MEQFLASQLRVKQVTQCPTDRMAKGMGAGISLLLGASFPTMNKGAGQTERTVPVSPDLCALQGGGQDEQALRQAFLVTKNEQCQSLEVQLCVLGSLG